MDVISKTESNEFWLAGANWLMAENRPGATEWLLREISVDAIFQVFDFARGIQPHAEIMFATPIATRSAAEQRSWPHRYFYSYLLTAEPESGDVLLSGGRNPIYYRREIGIGLWRSNVQVMSKKYPAIRNRLAAQLLEQVLLLNDNRPAIDPEPMLAYRWTGVKQYRRALEAFRGEQERRFSDVTGRLFSMGWLTARERDAARLLAGFERGRLSEEEAAAAGCTGWELAACRCIRGGGTKTRTPGRV